MKPITDIDELRRIELDILDHVAKFCDERGIKWFLIGGTLIGAVRHKGFVPWDDDIDIGMLRPDYERFVREFPDRGTYRLRTPERGSYMYPFTKVVDTRTSVREEELTARNLGVWIDVFPFDGAPSRDYCPSLTKTWRRIREYIRTRNLPVSGKGRRLARKLGIWATLPLRLLPNNRAALRLRRIAMRHSVSDRPLTASISSNSKGGNFPPCQDGTSTSPPSTATTGPRHRRRNASPHTTSGRGGNNRRHRQSTESNHVRKH